MQINTRFKEELKGFTLAEVLITLGIIGVVAALTIPPLVSKSQEQQWVSGLLKFNETLQQAVMMWKQDIGCTSDAYTCLTAQSLPDNSSTSFDQIANFMSIIDKGTTGKDWLANDIANYYGNFDTTTWGKPANGSCGVMCYLLKDGMTFSIDSDPDGFGIMADINGKKPPNRVGKDVFPFVIGKKSGKDVYYLTHDGIPSENGRGLCSTYAASCDLNNVDPTTSNGACPTGYVILRKALPDYTALAGSVAGFKP